LFGRGKGGRAVSGLLIMEPYGRKMANLTSSKRLTRPANVLGRGEWFRKSRERGAQSCKKKEIAGEGGGYSKAIYSIPILIFKRK